MGEHDQHRKRVYNRFLREGLMGFEEHNAMEFLLFLYGNNKEPGVLCCSRLGIVINLRFFVVPVRE